MEMRTDGVNVNRDSIPVFYHSLVGICNGI